MRIYNRGLRSIAVNSCIKLPVNGHWSPALLGRTYSLDILCNERQLDFGTSLLVLLFDLLVLDDLFLIVPNNKSVGS